MNTQTEKYVEISYGDLNLNERQLDELAEVGLKMIQNNKKDLVNYAVNKMLSDIVYEAGPEAPEQQRLDILRETIKLEIEG